MAKVFISYVRENFSEAISLAKDLENYGIEIWLDKQDIRPGSRWGKEIRNAIIEGDFFIACFSQEFEQKPENFMYQELIWAAEGAESRPSEQAWVIPVLFSECKIPDIDIGRGETLRSIQWVDLYKDWKVGIESIVNVIAPDAQPTVTDGTNWKMKLDDLLNEDTLLQINQIQDKISELEEWDQFDSYLEDIGLKIDPLKSLINNRLDDSSFIHYAWDDVKRRIRDLQTWAQTIKRIDQPLSERKTGSWATELTHISEEVDILIQEYSNEQHSDETYKLLDSIREIEYLIQENRYIAGSNRRSIYSEIREYLAYFAF